MAGVLSLWSDPQGQTTMHGEATESVKSQGPDGFGDVAEDFRFRCLLLAEEHEQLVGEHRVLVSMLTDMGRVQTFMPRPLGESRRASVAAEPSAEVCLDASDAVPAHSEPLEALPSTRTDAPHTESSSNFVARQRDSGEDFSAMQMYTSAMDLFGIGEDPMHSKSQNAKKIIAAVNDDAHRVTTAMRTLQPRCCDTMCSRWSARTRLRKIEGSAQFEIASIMVILVNTIFMIVNTEQMAQGRWDSEPTLFLIMEVLCTCLYAAELSIRLIVHRLRFFYGEDAAWRWLDIVLTLAAVQDIISLYILNKNGAGSPTVFRLLRLFKVVKVMRLIRVLRSVNELRMILDSIVSSVKAMVWVIVLITLVTFMFSMVFVQSSFDFGNEDARWSDLLTGMLHLLSVATGGEDWMEAYNEVRVGGQLYGCLFVTYIVFFAFVVQNTVTSVFVESMFSDKADNDILIMEERMREKSNYVKMIIKMFTKLMDESGNKDGVMREQLMANVYDPDMQNFASNLDIQEVDLQMFFDILTSHGSRPVDLETFVVGCIKLRGTAKSVDMVELMHDFKLFIKDYKEFSSFCEAHFKERVDEFDKFACQHSEFQNHIKAHFRKNKSHGNHMDFTSHFHTTRGVRSVGPTGVANDPCQL